jgi:hypothetical protein
MTVMTSYRLSHRFNDGFARSCAIAGFCLLVALRWTFLLQHVTAYPFVILYPGAVMGSAWFGGLVAGILAVFFSSILVAYVCIFALY